MTLENKYPEDYEQEQQITEPEFYLDEEDK